MAIDFNPERWKNIRETYELWWEDKLNRPIIPVILGGRDPGRNQPEVPLLSQTTCKDLEISPRDIIDRIDYELSKHVYLGDAFPYFNMDVFGPGIVAGFLGAQLDNSTGRVWFHPKEILPVTELHFEYNADNIWLNRIKDICYEGMKRWQGQVLVGMPDLGGILDILSVFRNTENLLIDLYDYPEEINRLVWEIHHLWYRFYNEICEILQPINPGYSDWSQIYSDNPSYILQSDFSYMISPEMFDKFVKPELEAICMKLSHTTYHLDGIGQLNHLDSLLTIHKLDVVQWVPGDGKADQACWPEVHQKIHKAGKKIQLFSGLDCLDTVAKQIGTDKGIHHVGIGGSISDADLIRKRLQNYGIA